MAEDDFFRPSKESARQNALNFLRGRSSLVGEVAVAIGPSWSLDETESLLEELGSTRFGQSAPSSTMQMAWA